MQLQRCHSTKHLGVIIDTNLTFEDHHHITEQEAQLPQRDSASANTSFSAHSLH